MQSHTTIHPVQNRGSVPNADVVYEDEIANFLESCATRKSKAEKTMQVWSVIESAYDNFSYERKLEIFLAACRAQKNKVASLVFKKLDTDVTFARLTFADHCEMFHRVASSQACKLVKSFWNSRIVSRLTDESLASLQGESKTEFQEGLVVLHDRPKTHATLLLENVVLNKNPEFCKKKIAKLSSIKKNGPIERNLIKFPRRPQANASSRPSDINLDEPVVSESNSDPRPSAPSNDAVQSQVNVSIQQRAINIHQEPSVGSTQISSFDNTNLHARINFQSSQSGSFTESYIQVPIHPIANNGSHIHRLAFRGNGFNIPVLCVTTSTATMPVGVSVFDHTGLLNTYGHVTSATLNFSQEQHALMVNSNPVQPRLPTDASSLSTPNTANNISSPFPELTHNSIDIADAVMENTTLSDAIVQRASNKRKAMDEGRSKKRVRFNLDTEVEKIDHIFPPDNAPLISSIQIQSHVEEASVVVNDQAILQVNVSAVPNSYRQNVNNFDTQPEPVVIISEEALLQIQNSTLDSPTSKHPLNTYNSLLTVLNELKSGQTQEKNTNTDLMYPDYDPSFGTPPVTDLPSRSTLTQREIFSDIFLFGVEGNKIYTRNQGKVVLASNSRTKVAELRASLCNSKLGQDEIDEDLKKLNVLTDEETSLIEKVLTRKL